MLLTLWTGIICWESTLETLARAVTVLATSVVLT